MLCTMTMPSYTEMSVSEMQRTIWFFFKFSDNICSNRIIIDYHQQYNTNSAQQQPPQQQTYRGTPAPVVQASVETPKRGSTRDYIQNSYSPQDVYQQSTLSDYTDDNYNAQVQLM